SRAVQQLAQSSQPTELDRRSARGSTRTIPPADLELLAQALAAEKFWGVQAELVVALGKAGGDTSRDALLQGMAYATPRLRRACVDALGRFRRDDKVAAALKALLEKGDPSYAVETAALSAYARLEQPDAAAVLMPWLAKPSHNEVIRSAALSALGSAKDLSALDALMEWTKPGKPRACRAAALGALAQLARTANPSAEQRQRIMTTLTEFLEGENTRLRMSALFALRDLGQAASPLLPVLDRLAQDERDERIREMVKRTAEQVRGSAPATGDVNRL